MRVDSSAGGGDGAKIGSGGAKTGGEVVTGNGAEMDCGSARSGVRVTGWITVGTGTLTRGISRTAVAVGRGPRHKVLSWVLLVLVFFTLGADVFPGVFTELKGFWSMFFS